MPPTRETFQGILGDLERRYSPDASLSFGRLPGSWGETYPNGDITIDKSALTPRGRRRMRREGREGWSTTGSPRGLLAHEYGHLVHHQTPGGEDVPGGFYSSAYAPGFIDFIRNITPTPAIVNAEQMGMQNSEYGMESIPEFFPEAFADVAVHGRGVSPINTAVTDWMTGGGMPSLRRGRLEGMRRGRRS